MASTPFPTVLLRLFILFIVLLALDVYVYHGLKTVMATWKSLRLRRLVQFGYWGVHLSFWAFLIYFTIVSANGGAPQMALFRILGTFLVLLYLPKLIFIPILLLEDVFRVFRAGGVWAWNQVTHPENPLPVWEGRRQFISQLGLGLASLPFAGVLYGVIKGKYAYKVHDFTFSSPHIPKAFDGFKIVQLSDIHAGSFDSKSDVLRGIEMVNAQKPDLILFTGDLVNNKADEMNEWMDVFGKLQATLGKYSILGNHDYGDYVQWESPEAKKQNLVQLASVHQELGFKLLRNEHARIEKDDAHFQLVGVENWSLGPGPFPRFGDLDKATSGLDAQTFTMLMSHDPSHWKAQALNHPHPFHLTLSGHTHGMQFGIEIPGFRWSPVKFRYPQWAGLYQHDDKTQHLYVNRGFGFLGFPGRVGIWPEITSITLKSA